MELKLSLDEVEEFDELKVITTFLERVKECREEYFNVVEILSSLINSFTNEKYKSAKICSLALCTDELLKEISKQDNSNVIKQIEDLEGKHFIGLSLQYNRKVPIEQLPHMSRRK